MPEKRGEKKRKNVKHFPLVIAILFAAAGLTAAIYRNSEKIDSRDERIAFIASLGWQADPASEESSIVRIPDCSEDFMAEYNRLMRRGGFDLSPFGGKSAERFSYRLMNYPDAEDSVYLILYLYQGKVIGGDIHSAALDGFMHELCPKEDCSKKQP